MERAAERLAAVSSAATSRPRESTATCGRATWSGRADRAWLVDPAAHGGHRETDLAFLALFGGAPFLDRVVAAYDEEWPLADGWRERVPAHQLHLMLVHTALFGSAYRGAVLDAARAVT